MRIKILAIILAAFLLIILASIKYNFDLKNHKNIYVSEKHAETQEIAKSIEIRFRYFYQALRTMSLVPGVRKIDRYGKEFSEDAKQTLQQIYNNAFENVKMSEIYILPTKLEPDKIDPITGKPDIPILTYDQFIVSDAAPAKEGEAPETDKLEQVEIEEYRLMKTQLKYFNKHFRLKSKIKDLNIPAISGKDVITCDNTEFKKEDLKSGNDFPRMGIVYTVPFYNMDGKLGGGISGVLRTKLLKEMLPKGNFALHHSEHNFNVENEPGDWFNHSKKFFISDKPNPGLIASFNETLDIRDTGQWRLWVAFDDNLFYASQGVKNSRTIYAFSVAIILGCMIGLILFIFKSEHHLQTLELKVTERTKSLNARNDDMRRILDNTEQGFLTLLPSGTFGVEHSKVIELWFGVYTSGTKMWDYFGAKEKNLLHHMKYAWQQVVSEMLPIGLALEQMPSKCKIDGTQLSFRYNPIFNSEGKMTQCLLVITDETNAMIKAATEASNREKMFIFDCILRDRSGFLEFIAETKKYVDTLGLCTDSATAKRMIHTIKGNCSIYGLNTISEICHNWEADISELGYAPNSPQYENLARTWTLKMNDFNSLLKEETNKFVEIEADEFNHIRKIATKTLASAELVKLMDSWQHEPMSVRLRRLSDQATAIAQRLEKQVAFEINSEFVRVDTKLYAGLWPNLIHVVRNAVDHGIESTSDRLTLEKTVPALLTLRTSTAKFPGYFCLEIADDGRGIAWEKLRAKAKEKGLPCETQKDLEAAIFAEDISTKEIVTEYSGRGVGLAAIKSEVDTLNGKIEIESAPNEGTLFRFLIPI